PADTPSSVPVCVPRLHQVQARHERRAHRRVHPQEARLDGEHSRPARSRGRPRRATHAAQLGRHAREACATYKAWLIFREHKLSLLSCTYKLEIISLEYGHSTASDSLAAPRTSAGLAPLAQVDTGGNG